VARPGVAVRLGAYHAEMIATAYLRVFLPLDAFPAAERARWSREIAEGPGDRPRRRSYRTSWTTGRLGVIVAEEDRADVRLVDETWYVCPWRTRIRTLASLLSLRDSVPAEVAEALVPEVEARKAARELARIRRRHPGAVPTLLQSAWHVPVRWFALVSDEERRIEQRPDGGYRLSYRTRVAPARERAEETLKILRDHDLDLVADLVEDLVAWLSVFPPEALVELDYGDVSDLFAPLDLDDDHSARDLRASLEALAAGDVDRAGELYQTVAMRWAEVKTRESLN